MKFAINIIFVLIVQSINGAPVDQPKPANNDLRQITNEAVVVSENSSPRQPSGNKSGIHKILSAEDQQQVNESIDKTGANEPSQQTIVSQTTGAVVAQQRKLDIDVSKNEPSIKVPIDEQLVSRDKHKDHKQDEPKIVNKKSEDNKEVNKAIENKNDIKIEHNLDTSLSQKNNEPQQQQQPSPSVLSIDTIVKSEPNIVAKSQSPSITETAVHRSESGQQNIENTKNDIKVAEESQQQPKPITSEPVVAIEAKKQIIEETKVENVNKDDNKVIIEKKMDETVKNISSVESKIAEPVIQANNNDLNKVAVAEDNKNIVNIDHVAEDQSISNSGKIAGEPVVSRSAVDVKTIAVVPPQPSQQ